MKYFRRVGITLLALSMGLGGYASAKDRDPPKKKDTPSKQVYNQRGEARDKKGDWRGAGPSHNFYRGGKLTSQYRSRQYVVDDWRGHRLSAPPRGYHWVQTGADYVLVAIATGVILQVLLDH